MSALEADLEALADDEAEPEVEAALADIENRIAFEVESARRYGAPSKIRVPVRWYKAMALDRVGPMVVGSPLSAGGMWWMGTAPIVPDTRLRREAVVEVRERGELDRPLTSAPGEDKRSR